MYDIERLQNLYLPIDKLIFEFRTALIGELKHLTKYNQNRIIFHNFITLEFIMDPEVRRAVLKYIPELIVNKEEYGHLYFLNTQKLILPLHLNFNAELVIDPSNFVKVLEQINNLASQFSCPIKDSLFFEITQLEVLYFLTIIVNPHLNWVTVDFILRGNKTHDYLIAFKKRIIDKTWPDHPPFRTKCKNCLNVVI